MNILITYDYLVGHKTVWMRIIFSQVVQKHAILYGNWSKYNSDESGYCFNYS